MARVYRLFLFQNCPFALDIQKNKKIKFLEMVCAGTTVSFGGVKLVHLQNSWSAPGLAHSGKACK